jgi:carotenoid cleavage dioxygenase
LDAKGSEDFGGSYRGPFTAHPKYDPETGELLVFGYMADGPGSANLSFTILDAAGRVTRHDRFAAPFPSMMHDFIATDEHVVFPVFPAVIDGDRAGKGGPLIAWEPSAGTHIGIVRRDADLATMRWFEGEPCYVYHAMNAFTSRAGGRTRLIADVVKFDRVPLFPNPDGSLTGTGQDAARGRLVRWSFDLDGSSNSFEEEPLTDLLGEFPRVDERFAGLSYRHGYYAASRERPPLGGAADSLTHFDLATGVHRTWTPGKGRFVGEPVFVARTATAAEGDGWLLSLVYDSVRNVSDLVILDATDLAAGPVARVVLPVRVPFGFHGNWCGVQGNSTHALRTK